MNVLIKGMAKRTAAKGRFRLYKSETYPNIHDEYVEYLKTLKKAVESCNDEQIAHCLNEVY